MRYFNLRGMHHALVAAALRGACAIAIRDWCFYTDPAMMRLLDVDKAAAAGIRAELVAGRHARSGRCTALDAAEPANILATHAGLATDPR